MKRSDASSFWWKSNGSGRSGIVAALLLGLILTLPSCASLPPDAPISRSLPCGEEPKAASHLRLERIGTTREGTVNDVDALTAYLLDLREWGTRCQAAAELP